eukprot:TRINITY_DN1163_c0_g1_i4.p1 TRINITY_DN1163_c0_g1~~TRINITY_DN1163_c0_g1_i4.p1  ORF type:complete len:285 (-),score=53.92 TRINITY_DN1163_c0_g1_i4:88-942(-)
MKASRQTYRSFVAAAIFRRYVFARSCNLHHHAPRIIHYSTTSENNTGTQSSGLGESKNQQFSTSQINIPEDQKKMLQPILMQWGISSQDLPRVLQELPRVLQELQIKVDTLTLDLVHSKNETIAALWKVIAALDKVIAAEREKGEKVTVAQKEVTAAEEKVTAAEIEKFAAQVEQYGLEKELAYKNEKIDRANGHTNIRGVIEGIADDICRMLNIEVSTTEAINMLFSDKNDKGKAFLAKLQPWIRANGLVENDVIVAGKGIYSFLSSYQHGSYPEEVNTCFFQ